MKALTICQPYAELIIRGEKPIENRTWPTSYRGPLLIHAGKSHAWLDEDDEIRYPRMAFGALVAISKLVDCVRIEKLPAPLVGHAHANGPWCWLLDDIVKIRPIPCSGAQGLWIPSPLLLADLLEAAHG